jgi:hypothetical protein
MKNILFTFFLIICAGSLILLMGNFFFYLLGWVEKLFTGKTVHNIVLTLNISGGLTLLVRLLPGRTWV